MMNPYYKTLPASELKLKFLARQHYPKDYISDQTFRNYLKKTHSFKRGHCYGDNVNSDKNIKMRQKYAI